MRFRPLVVRIRSSRNARSRSRAAAVITAAIASGAVPGSALAAPVIYPMSPQDWHPAARAAWSGPDVPSIKFDDRDEGFPNGIMTVNGAVAVSNGAHFRNGTIDFDIKLIDYNYTGIIFRRAADGDGEFFYLRGDPDCPASDDCYQYTPIVHGMLQWNAYPNYQGPAAIAPLGWNHVHLVVSGGKMEAFLNHATTPTLVVPALQGLTTDGGIAFKGPAVYANLVINPDAPSLDDIPAPQPDPDAVLDWQTATPTVWPAGQPVPASNIPGPDAWQPIAAEPWGLVDLSRRFAETHGQSTEVGWLRTTIVAPAPERRMLHLGWISQVSVFLDGRRIFTGDNPYYPVERRISADGRLDPNNAVIPLDLAAGHHDLVLAVGNGWPDKSGALVATHDGWAAEAHLDRPGNAPARAGEPAGK